MWQCRRHLCRGAEAVSLGLVLKTNEILQLQFIDKVVDFCCAGPSSSGAVGEETVELPQLQLVLWTRSLTCPLCSTREAGCQSAENCEGPAVASDKVVDVPVSAVHRRFGRPCDHAATSSCSPRSLTRMRLRFSSSSECGTFLLCSGDVYAQCNLCRRPGVPWYWYSSWELSICLLLYNDRCRGTACACNWSSTVAACWQSGRLGGGRRFAAAFRPGVGAHHTGDGLN